MPWHPTERLAHYAHEAARRKHPAGYGKAKLVAASKEVFGGFGAAPRTVVRSEDDIDHSRNALALVDGHYPLGMTGCEVVGLSGGCGPTCPVLSRGECDTPTCDDSARDGQEVTSNGQC